MTVLRRGKTVGTGSRLVLYILIAYGSHSNVALATDPARPSKPAVVSTANLNPDQYQHAVILDDYLYFIDEDNVVRAQDATGKLITLYQLPEDEEDPYNGEWSRRYSFESLYAENGKVYLVQEQWYVEPYYSNTSYSLLTLDAVTGSVTEVESEYYPYGDPELGFPDINDVISVTSFAGKKYYVFETEDYGQELWAIKGEGSNRRFTLLADFMPGAGHGGPASFHEFKGDLYFTAASPGFGRELWKMDAAENIQQVADINPDGDAFEDPEGGSLSPSFSGNHFVDLFYEYQGNLFFAADHIDFGRELWKTDGTKSGTQIVLDAYPGPNGFSKTNYQPIKFSDFQDDDGFYYNEVEYSRVLARWVSDGTAEGTHQVGVGTIGDYVWLDSNGNGRQDANESGLADVYVELYECEGNGVTSTYTDDNGAYLFDQVTPGKYQIYFSLPDGYRFSPRAAGNFRYDSNVFADTSMTRCLSMSPGQVRDAIDAGMVPDSGEPELDLVRAIYFSEEHVLWVRGASNTRPAGSATLTVSAVFGATQEILGQLPWRSYKGYYQRRFFNLSDVPESIKLVDKNGEEVIGKVEVR